MSPELKVLNDIHKYIGIEKADCTYLLNVVKEDGLPYYSTKEDLLKRYAEFNKQLKYIEKQINTLRVKELICA